MTYITRALLLAAVQAQQPVFESHHVIQWLMTHHPKEYARELYANVGADDPIRTTHSAIGRALHDVPGIVPNARVDSPNVRGPVTENQQWRKV